MSFNDPFLATFGESVTFKPIAGDVVLRAIVEPDNTTENLQQVKIDNQSLLLYIDDSAVAGKNIARRQEVMVRNQAYKIIEIGNDMNGLTIYRVSKS